MKEWESGGDLGGKRQSLLLSLSGLNTVYLMRLIQNVFPTKWFDWYFTRLVALLAC